MNQKLTQKWVRERLSKRPKDSNKGTFGRVLVVAGSENYPGAAYLSSAACYRVGAGLVTLATEPQVKIIVSRKLPEVTFLSRNEAFKKINGYDVLLIGPGLGQSNQAIRLMEQILNKDLPAAIIDGDGLNILSKKGEWWKNLSREVILTPHPGEMARLTGKSVEEIQLNRVDVAQYFSKKWNTIIVLKGANTLVVSPAGQILISPFANSILSTAGTGDILSGVIAGLLAQGSKTFDAACIGVYIHGLVGEVIQKKLGDAGMLAGDMLLQIPLILKELR